jgi:hypothetical protein
MDAIALFALRFGVASPSETNERGNNIARGSVLYASIWMDAYEFYDLVPSNYRLVEAWGDSMYRLVWVDPFRREVLTYCEGDVTLVTCPTEESYMAELDDAASFYGHPFELATA